MTGKPKAILFAFLAAVFYAINVPVSKILLREVGPTTMAALLYLGAGIGIGILSLINKKDREKSEPLTRKDLPFVLGMIILGDCLGQEGGFARNRIHSIRLAAGVRGLEREPFVDVRRSTGRDGGRLCLGCGRHVEQASFHQGSGESAGRGS